MTAPQKTPELPAEDAGQSLRAVTGYAAAELVECEHPECPNCKERKTVCACLRNTCIQCGAPVGNITFTVCDACWDKPHTHVI